MAKTGFWLRGAKGKLAGATMYQQNGETVMREVVTPANPKTTAQIVQRIIMHTVMAAYSKMKVICDHSFEGMKKGQECMSYFQKQNIQFARDKVAEQQAAGMNGYAMFNYMPLGQKGFTPNQYQISMGSLPQVGYSLDTAANALYVPGLSGSTYGDIINSLNLKRGDQLTFVFIAAIGNSNSLAANEFHYARIILDPTNADGSQAPLSTPFIVGSAINLPSVRNEGTVRLSYNEDNQLYIQMNNADVIMAAAVIASRKSSDGSWLRSTQYLAYRPAFGVVYSLGACIDLAKNGGASIYAANELYLNNAGEGSNAGVDTGSTGEPRLTQVTVGGVQLISGTTRNIELPSGTVMPYSIAVAASGTGLDGLQLSVTTEGGNSVAENADFVNGAATTKARVSANTVYVVTYSNSEEFADSGFKFTVKVSGGGGGLPGDLGNG